MNTVYLYIFHFVCGVVAVLNGVKVFSKSDKTEIKILKKRIEVRDGTIIELNNIIKRQQAIIDHDRKNRN